MGHDAVILLNFSKKGQTLQLHFALRLLQSYSSADYIQSAKSSVTQSIYTGSSLSSDYGFSYASAVIKSDTGMPARIKPRRGAGGGVSPEEGLAQRVGEGGRSPEGFFSLSRDHVMGALSLYADWANLLGR